MSACGAPLQGSSSYANQSKMLEYGADATENNSDQIVPSGATIATPFKNNMTPQYFVQAIGSHLAAGVNPQAVADLVST